MIHPKFNRFNGLKLLAYSDRLRGIAEGGKPFPLDWHIYPSNICNHKCVWCMFRQDTPSGQEGEQIGFRVKLSRELLLKAVEDAARTDAKLIHFSGGGEPLLNRHTLEAMQAANKAGIKVALSTNGRSLTPEVAQAVDYIRVSLNAGSAEQHWKTNHGADERDPGDWFTILQNIKICVPHKRSDFGLGYVVDSDNYGDIYAFCEHASQLGVDFVHIRPAFFYEEDKNKAVRAIMPSALKISERAKEDFGEMVDIFSLSSAFEGYWTPRSYNCCRAVWTGVCLRATGDFAVCQDRTDLTFGKAWSQGATFEEVWAGEEHQKVVASITEGQELDRCPRCVWNGRNEIIESVFIKDDMRLALI